MLILQGVKIETSYDPDPGRRRKRRCMPRVRYRTRYLRLPRRKKGRKISLLSTLGLIASPFIFEKGYTAPAISVMNAIKDPNWGWSNVAADTLRAYVGYDPRFGHITFPRSTGVIVLGFVAHKIASWLGVNRMLGRAPSPLNKISL
jgi:hypothetical protein